MWLCVLVDYAIPGTPAAATSSECSFVYRSSSGSKVGAFLSPRHPSYYPDRTVCDYKFIGMPNEQVRITFENFKVENGGAKYVRCHFHDRLNCSQSSKARGVHCIETGGSRMLPGKSWGK